jgi:hypothetical protein
MFVSLRSQSIVGVDIPLPSLGVIRLLRRESMIVVGGPPPSAVELSVTKPDRMVVSPKVFSFLHGSIELTVVFFRNYLQSLGHRPHAPGVIRERILKSRKMGGRFVNISLMFFPPQGVPDRYLQVLYALQKRVCPRTIPVAHTEHTEVAVRHEVIPAKVRVKREPESSVTFTRHQRDVAYHAQVERYVAWARELLNDTPRIIDSPMIQERQVDAARAVLDVLWAVIAERNLTEGEPHLLPGLIAHHRHTPELRRLARSSAS